MDVHTDTTAARDEEHERRLDEVVRALQGAPARGRRWAAAAWSAPAPRGSGRSCEREQTRRTPAFEGVQGHTSSRDASSVPHLCRVPSFPASPSGCSGVSRCTALPSLPLARGSWGTHALCA